MNEVLEKVAEKSVSNGGTIAFLRFQNDDQPGAACNGKVNGTGGGGDVIITEVTGRPQTRRGRKYVVKELRPLIERASPDASLITHKGNFNGKRAQQVVLV